MCSGFCQDRGRKLKKFFQQLMNLANSGIKMDTSAGARCVDSNDSFIVKTYWHCEGIPVWFSLTHSSKAISLTSIYRSISETKSIKERLLNENKRENNNISILFIFRCSFDRRISAIYWIDFFGLKYIRNMIDR